MADVKVFNVRKYDALEWRSRASCKDMSPSLFYLENQRSVPTPIKQLCNACPVQQECLMFAIENHERYGIWGGLGYRTRLTIAKRLKLAAE